MRVCCADRYLFKVAVFAGPLLGVLVVDDVQRSLPLFHLQTLDLGLELIELLLQVFALLHVLHPEHGQTSRSETHLMTFPKAKIKQLPDAVFNVMTHQQGNHFRVFLSEM